MTRGALIDLDAFQARGFHVVPARLSDSRPADLTEAFDRAMRGTGNAGRRDGLSIPAVRALVSDPILADLVEAVLGPGAFAVRATLFDKTSASNWLVSWHQDLSIPVERRVETPEFRPWSVKDGVPCVQPPAGVLEAMLSVRVHLDDCGASDGPLRVIPGSHLRGKLSMAEIADLNCGADSVECPVPAGGALVMRPLLLHASSKAESPTHRRVVHLEFAGGDLPGKLRWKEKCFPHPRPTGG